MVYEVRNIDKSYQNNQVLKKVSFHIPSNKITVILGKNGAGKTTLIKLMLGMITVDKGEILFKGNPISKLRHTYYKQVSAVLESVDNVYPFLTGKQNIEYFLGLSNLSISYVSDSIQHLINEFDLKDAINQPVGGYSRGMLQKLSLLISLITNADVLFLDEPTLGLDFQSSKQLCRKIKELAKREHKTIILTSHQADIIELLADYIIVLDEGSVIYSGDYQDFLSQVPNSDEYIAVLDGDLPGVELDCHRDKGKSYIKRESFEDLYSILKENSLIRNVIKIEKVKPTVEDALIYFYNHGVEK